MSDAHSPDLSPVTRRRLAALAAEQGLSVSDFVARLLDEYNLQNDTPGDVNPFTPIIGIVQTNHVDLSARVTQILQGFAAKYNWKPSQDGHSEGESG